MIHILHKKKFVCLFILNCVVLIILTLSHAPLASPLLQNPGGGEQSPPPYNRSGVVQIIKIYETKGVTCFAKVIKILIHNMKITSRPTRRKKHVYKYACGKTVFPLFHSFFLPSFYNIKRSFQNLEAIMKNVKTREGFLSV